MRDIVRYPYLWCLCVRRDSVRPLRLLIALHICIENLHLKLTPPIHDPRLNTLHLQLGRTITSVFLWWYANMSKGLGMEFRDLRRYIPGDPVKHIDRKTSAKKQDIYIKQYDDQKWLNVWLLHDAHMLDPLDHTAQDMRQTINTLMYTLWYATISNQDRLGYIYTGADEAIHMATPTSRRYNLRELMKHTEQSLPSRTQVYIQWLQKVLGLSWKVSKKISVLEQLKTLQPRRSLLIYTVSSGHIPFDSLQAFAQYNEILLIDIYSQEELTLTSDTGTIHFAWGKDVWDDLEPDAVDIYTTHVAQQLKNNARRVRSLWGRYIYMHTGSDVVRELMKQLKS